MSITAMNPAFWKIQLHHHFQRFYPEWIRQINNPDLYKGRALQYYKQRPLQAEREFKVTLQSSSVDQALESALQLLTVDLPEPIYPDIIKVLDELQIETLTEDKILDLCDKIRSDCAHQSSIVITKIMVTRYLNL
jgi:hypothetical protein